MGPQLTRDVYDLFLWIFTDVYSLISCDYGQPCLAASSSSSSI